MEVRNYSLADHSIVFESASISLNIANGSSMENFSIEWENDNFSYSVAADGSASLNKNYRKNGMITINLMQTNPLVQALVNAHNIQMKTGAPTEKMQGTIMDSDGNINAEFNGCVIVKIPNYEAGDTSASRSFVIIFSKGVEL